MNRYLLTFLFTIAVISLYCFVDIRFFNLDLNRIVKNSLFEFKNKYADNSVVIYNVGELDADELMIRIDSMLLANPRIIGVNLCHLVKISSDLIASYKNNQRVIFADCLNGSGSLSQIIYEDNIVTHFKTDRTDYFESQLTSFSGRGNENERINYGIEFYISELRLDTWYFPSVIEGSTILLGYMGESYFPGMISDYTTCRITPLNKYYGEDNILPDMYDVQISATIISMINKNDFVLEFPQWQRILFLLGICLLNVIALMFIKTRWVFINLIVATVLFMLLTGAGSYLVVHLFVQGYYLVLDELPYMLLVTTVFTVGLAVFEKQENKEFD